MGKNTVENLVPKFRKSKSYQPLISKVHKLDLFADSDIEAVASIVWYQRMNHGSILFNGDYKDPGELEKELFICLYGVFTWTGWYSIDKEKVLKIKQSTIEKYKRILNQ